MLYLSYNVSGAHLPKHFPSSDPGECILSHVYMQDLHTSVKRGSPSGAQQGLSLGDYQVYHL